MTIDSPFACAQSPPAPVPRIVPALLSFTAGYVDACMFLALSGFFVAQVTGSFVVVGTELVHRSEGFLVKALAIPVFFAAGVLTTILAAGLRGRSALAWTLALECVLLGAFLALGLVFPIQRDPSGAPAVLGAILGLSSMGVQSASVRLHLPRLPSTNVMTTNTTVFAIDTAELLLGWRRKRIDAAAAAQFAAARARLGVLVPIWLGFLFGSAAGAVGYAWSGPRCLLAILALLIGLVGWASRRPTPRGQDEAA